jgi:hypothetical protein
VRYHSLRALASLGRMTFARLRDLLDAAKLVFASCAGVAAFAALGYLPATGFLAVAGDNPVTGIGAGVACPAWRCVDSGHRRAARKRERAWLRLRLLRRAGSGAFIPGSIVSGQAVKRYGLAGIIWLNDGLSAARSRSQPSLLPSPRR